MRTLSRLLRWIAPAVALGVCHLTAWAQPTNPAPARPTPGVPVGEFFLAFVGIGVVLAILCLPSRKQF